MTIHHSKYVSGPYRVPASQWAGDVVCATFEVTVPATGVAEGDIIELGLLPAHHRLFDAILISDDLDTDSSPAIVWDIGLMNGEVGADLEDGNARTCGDELFDGTNVSQAGGMVRASNPEMWDVAPTDKDRSIGAKLVTDADVAQAGKLKLIVFYGT